MRIQTTEGENEKEGLLEREVEIQLPEVAPFSSVSIPLTVLAELGPQRDAATIEHTVSSLRRVVVVKGLIVGEDDNDSGMSISETNNDVAGVWNVGDVMTVVMSTVDGAGECQQQPGGAAAGRGRSLHPTLHVVPQAAHGQHLQVSAGEDAIATPDTEIFFLQK